jgi:hypothetical protein
MAYDRIDPFGTQRGDLQAGIVASTLINIFSKNGNATPDNFLLQFEHRVRRSAQDIYAMIKTWAIAQGAKRKK